MRKNASTESAIVSSIFSLSDDAFRNNSYRGRAPSLPKYASRRERIESINMSMKSKLLLIIAVAWFVSMVNGRGQEPDPNLGARSPNPAAANPADLPSELPAVVPSPTSGAADARAPEFKNLSDLKWDKILPDLGADSPEICILHVDPKTQATQLLIRTPKAIHVRKHWHTSNETHTLIKGTATLACEGKKVELAPGGFNFMPAKMVHEAWLPADSLTFITVDGAWDINWVEGPPTQADLSRAY
jgi:mannose-6-phosphate isomerase-like protein (cupin superfamily)